MNKSKFQLRKIYKQIRMDVHHGLDLDKKEHLHNVIRERLIKILSSLNFQNNIMIAGYYPIQSEMDCLKILQDLQKSSRLQIGICLPKMMNDRDLAFFTYHGEDNLIKGKFNLVEPDPSKSKEVLPDVIITPLLAFDRNRHRLGYGKGCYDSTFDNLTKIGHKFLTIGLGYDEQFLQDELLPSEVTDYPLDYVISPSYVLV